MVNDTSEDEYELLPHKEIEELRGELTKLKDFEITPSKKLNVSILELNHKLDKLITIFEDAQHQLRVEDGGLSFTDKMKPLLEKMNKILEQNAEIASGILALADMAKGEMPKPMLTPYNPMEAGLPPLPRQTMQKPMPTMQSMQQTPTMPPNPSAQRLPPLPPLPPPPKRTFGL